MTGGAASGRRGAAYERRLVNAFGAAGWFALRVPSSGSATADDLPDVLAMRPVAGGTVRSEAWAVELKSGSATTLYADEREVEALRALAESSGAVPYLGARFTSQDTGTEFYLVRPRDARRTQGEDAGNYGLPRADVAERASAVVREDGTVEVDP